MGKKLNLIVFSLMLAQLCFFKPLSADEVVDRIVAMVDGDIITLVQLNREAGLYIKNIEESNYTAEKKNEMIAATHKKVLDALIDRSLTQQEARKYNIEVSEAEVNAAVENVKKSRAMTQEMLETALKNENLSLDEYREGIRKQILQSRIINHAVKSKVVITESDIRAQYDKDAEKHTGKKKYHLRNILLKNQGQVLEVKTKLDEKQSFASLAKAYSVAPNASDGGDLGVFDIENFSQDIKDSISVLNKGETTDVISTAQGFQFFYIEDIVTEGGKTYEQLHDQIHEKLYKEQVDKKFGNWLESLKEKAHIKVML
jgi:peptidyl-prolyl cis-trans isomerase SurA